MTSPAENFLHKFHLTFVPRSRRFFLCRFSSTAATTAIAAAAATLTMVTVDPEISAATECDNDNASATRVNEICGTIISSKLPPMDGVDFAGAAALSAGVDNGRGDRGEIRFGLDLDTALWDLGTFFFFIHRECNADKNKWYYSSMCLVSGGSWCMPCQIYDSLPPIINHLTFSLHIPPKPTEWVELSIIPYSLPNRPWPTPPNLSWKLSSFQPPWQRR